MDDGCTRAQRWLWCEACGKRTYTTRKNAKAARNRTREKGMGVYDCPKRPGEGLFHVGHRPRDLGQGLVDRDEVRQREEARGLLDG